MYINIESVCYAPKMNIMLYVCKLYLNKNVSTIKND